MQLPAFDITSAASRRKFFLSRVLRRNSRGTGSDLAALLERPGTLHAKHRLEMLATIFGDEPVTLIGAHAVAAYAPERMTSDVDCLTLDSAYTAACRRLESNGYRKHADLAFPTTALGLYGSHWTSEHGIPVNIIATTQPWGREAFDAPPRFASEGDRVIPLEYLVLMKLDAARSTDQGDLSRILGRLSDAEVTSVINVVAKHYGHDPAAIDDVRQYAEVGRWEYGSSQ